MKVSFDWLKDYVQIDISAGEVAERLIHTGFNLEEIREVAGDSMLDLEVTSNRPDCLGHLGIAREIAAVFGKEMNLPDVTLMEEETPVTDLAAVEILTPDLCPRYMARVIRNVKIGPSPAWLVKRLETIGLRSVNNVVDITNYVMMETGQPLHAFDLDKLCGKKIIVRQARPGEMFFAIDHSEHKLDSRMLVIADGERAVAMAGVMGGVNTEVTETTKNILLESAEFEPVCIRQTARKLNLRSDSSYRFERKVDPVGVEWASKRAAKMMVELCGGKLAKGAIDCWATPWTPHKIELKMAKVEAMLGFKVEMQKAIQILSALGFNVVSHDQEKMTVVVPSFRAEASRPIDLVEEIGRIAGLGNVPIRETVSIRAVPPSKTERFDRRVHQALNQCGFNEAITVTMVEPAIANMFTNVPKDNVLRVAGVRRQANDALRCSLIASLLAVRRLNQDAGNAISNLYEIAHVFLPGDKSGELPHEYRELAILNSEGDLRAIRGALELMTVLTNSPQKIRLEPKQMEWFLPDQSAVIWLGEKELGIAGTISQKIQKQFDLKKPAAVARINYTLFSDQPMNPVTVSPIAKFPAIERDLSIVVKEDVRWEEIEKAVHDLKLPELEALEFGELFRGKQIPKGQKSLFFRLRYRNPDRSLTHEEVDTQQKLVIETLEKSFQAQLRAS
jgi:phenylalanyl-tRNA synthetase beta chain